MVDGQDGRAANLHYSGNPSSPITGLTCVALLLEFAQGGGMKDIHEVLRHKQAKYAQLGKQIEMLQQAAEKLREVAPLLAENDEDDSAILGDTDEPTTSVARATAAPAVSQPSAAKPFVRGVAPRWP